MEKIILNPMTNSDFENYFKDKIKRYSEVLSQNAHEKGEDPSIKAREQLNNLLPKGIETANHYLFNIAKEENAIGFVWIKIEQEQNSSFLYEIFIDEEFRSMGYGTIVMRKIEELLKQRDVQYFKLHVFGSNSQARKLYEELGFDIVGLNMMKTLNI